MGLGLLRVVGELPVGRSDRCGRVGANRLHLQREVSAEKTGYALEKTQPPVHG